MELLPHTDCISGFRLTVIIYKSIFIYYLKPDIQPVCVCVRACVRACMCVCKYILSVWCMVSYGVWTIENEHFIVTVTNLTVFYY